MHLPAHAKVYRAESGRTFIFIVGFDDIIGDDTILYAPASNKAYFRLKGVYPTPVQYIDGEATFRAGFFDPREAERGWMHVDGDVLYFLKDTYHLQSDCPDRVELDVQYDLAATGAH